MTGELSLTKGFTALSFPDFFTGFALMCFSLPFFFFYGVSACDNT